MFDFHLISPAYAQDAGAGATLTSLLPLVLIFVVFYMLLIRPQQKKMKQHRNMVANLRRGDKVVTAGGLLGQVTKVVSDTELQVELAEGVRVRVVKGTISEVLSKPDPAKGGTAAANDDQGKPKSLLGGLFGGGGPKRS
ncbi:MAG: preprotein translocase subunit YajC [Pseudomonadota bacterium]